MRTVAASLTAMLTLSCAQTPEPYDQDVAYCRRAARSPSTSAPSAESTFSGKVTTGSYSHGSELVTGLESELFAGCMRTRFNERFPGLAYPLDP